MFWTFFSIYAMRASISVWYTVKTKSLSVIVQYIEQSKNQCNGLYFHTWEGFQLNIYLYRTEGICDLHQLQQRLDQWKQLQLSD